MNHRQFKTALLTTLAVILLLGLLACGSSTNFTGMSARQLFDYGLEKYQAEKYLTSIDAFQAVVFNYPGVAFIDSAQYYLALSYYGNKDYTLGGVEFNRLLLNYPSSSFAPEAQLMKAICYFEGTPKHYGLDQSDLQLAIEQFEDFLVDYPESPALEDCKTYLKIARTRLAHKHYVNGMVYVHVRDYRAARVYFQKVIDEYTNTEYAPMAAYEIADTYFNAHDWDKAHEQFENFSIAFADNQLAPKAAEKACEALVKGGEEAFKNGELDVAKRRLDRFMTACGQDTDRLDKVNELLKKIGDAPMAEAAGEDGGA